MKVLVTGGSGFLGSALVRHLLKEGYSVRTMIRSESERYLIEGLDIEVIKGDIIHPQAVNRAVSGCNAVFHLASAYTFYPWWQCRAKGLYKINVDGTKNVLAAALKYKVERFIFTSSVASIGKNLNGKPSDEDTIFNLWHVASHYARSKVMAEYEVLKFSEVGLPALILNPALIIGERDHKPTPSGEIIIKFLNRDYLCYFDAVLSIADADDVARAHVAALRIGKIGERYILCNQAAYKMREIFTVLEQVSGVRAPQTRIPYPLLLGFTYADEVISCLILRKKPLMPSEGIKFCNLSIQFDNSKAVRELGYSETPIKETIAKAVKWYRDNGYVKNA